MATGKNADTDTTDDTKGVDRSGSSQEDVPFADDVGQYETSDMVDGNRCKKPLEENKLDGTKKKYKNKIAQLKDTVKDLKSQNSSLRSKIAVVISDEKGQPVSVAETQTDDSHNDEELKKLYEQKDKKEAEIKELVLRILILQGKDGKVQQTSVETQTEEENINEGFQKNNENDLAKMWTAIARLEKEVKELKSHPSFSTNIGQDQVVTDEYAKEDQTQMKSVHSTLIVTSQEQNAEGNKHSKLRHEIKNETSCTIELNPNRHSTTRKLDRIVYVYIKFKSPSEVTKMLKRQLMETLYARLKYIGFVGIQNIDDIEKGPPLLALCVNASRMKTDASNAIKGIRELKNTVLVIFHHVEHHADMSLQSSQTLSGQQFSRLAGIYDMAFLKEKGFYQCDMNTKTEDSIVAFLTKQYPKPEKGKLSSMF